MNLSKQKIEFSVSYPSSCIHHTYTTQYKFPLTWAFLHCFRDFPSYSLYYTTHTNRIILPTVDAFAYCIYEFIMKKIQRFAKKTFFTKDTTTRCSRTYNAFCIIMRISSSENRHWLIYVIWNEETYTTRRQIVPCPSSRIKKITLETIYLCLFRALRHVCIRVFKTNILWTLLSDIIDDQKIYILYEIHIWFKFIIIFKINLFFLYYWYIFSDILLFFSFSCNSYFLFLIMFSNNIKRLPPAHAGYLFGGRTVNSVIRIMLKVSED